MSDVVKKGYLSVRRRNLLSSSSYKQRYVVLRIGQQEHSKLVEVWDSQTSEKEPYRLVLGNTWTVQDKPSNSGKRYAFQVSTAYLYIADSISVWEVEGDFITSRVSPGCFACLLDSCVYILVHLSAG
jgi:hypothetical protein